MSPFFLFGSGVCDGLRTQKRNVDQMFWVQLEVLVTPEEIKKTPRIPRISRICQEILDQAAPVQTDHPPGFLNLWNP
jgi:hypothetical protein